MSKLGVECVKDDSQSFESSDSFNERTKKRSNTSNSRNAHEKVELTPFMCCSKCSGQNLCAVCHKPSITNNPVYVCRRHKSAGPNCPICHSKANLTSHSRLCNKCKLKYGHNCIICG